MADLYIPPKPAIIRASELPRSFADARGIALRNTFGPAPVFPAAGVFARKPVPDPNTVLLLHFDGADAATSFPDSALGGSAPHTVTANGNAQIDTAQSKFGGASLLLDGTGDYLSVPNHADFDVGIGGEPFCIEFFLRRNGDTAYTPYSRGGGAGGWSATNGTYLQFLGDTSNLFFQVNVSGSPVSVSGGHPTDATWVHVAGTYDGSFLRLFYDGVSQGTPQSVAGLTAPTTRNVHAIGRAQSATTHDLNGHIDEFRISKGVARYTSNFSPPTAPFSAYL